VGALTIRGELFQAIMATGQPTRDYFLEILAEPEKCRKARRLTGNNEGKKKCIAHGYYLIWREVPPPPEAEDFDKETPAARADRKKVEESVRANPFAYLIVATARVRRITERIP
jgi:hypothetical protein